MSEDCLLCTKSRSKRFLSLMLWFLLFKGGTYVAQCVVNFKVFYTLITDRRVVSDLLFGVLCSQPWWLPTDGSAEIAGLDIVGLDIDGRICGQLTELKLQNFIPWEDSHSMSLKHMCCLFYVVINLVFGDSCNSLCVKSTSHMLLSHAQTYSYYRERCR